MSSSSLSNQQLPTLPDPYVAEKLLGKGSYGIVFQARHTGLNKLVAVKKIPLSRLGPVDRKRVWREIRIAKFIRHKNINHLLDVQLHQEETTITDSAGNVQLQKQYFIYQVFELMDTDLHKIITSPQELTEDHIKWFLYQILRGINYLHSAGILHRDLKPSNLLVNSNCKLKIGDFGLARQITLMNFYNFNNSNDAYTNDENARNEMTKYIVTRWYRAPELLINSPHYGTRVDIWSVGCIFAELLNRRPLLRGQNYMEQLKYIIKLCGTPSAEDMRFGSTDAQAFIQRLPKIPPTDLKSIFPYASPEALDLLQSMLRFNPEKRCTVEEALAHPYLASMRRKDTETTYSNPFNFLQPYEEKIKNEEDLIQLLQREALSLHPEACMERLMELQKETSQYTNVDEFSTPTLQELVEEESMLRECLKEYDYIMNLA